MNRKTAAAVELPKARVLSVFIAGELLFLLLTGCATVQRQEGEADGGGRTGEQEVAPVLEGPPPIPGFDGSHRGVYKGVLTDVDDSGVFRLSVENDSGETVQLSGRYKGKRFRLEGSTEYLPEREAYRYRFTGTAGGGEVRIEFRTSISRTGVINRSNTEFRVDGEPVHLNVMKERSEQEVRVYEGQYSGSASGNWNFLLRGEEIAGYYAGDETGEFEGRYESGNQTLYVWELDGDMLARGTLEEGTSRARGAWRFTAGADYSSESSEELYPRREGTSNRWQGRRALPAGE